MTSSNGNIFRVTGPLCGEFTGPGEFPAQRPVTRSFDVFFELRPNKRLSKQPWRRRRGHCDVIVMFVFPSPRPLNNKKKMFQLGKGRSEGNTKITIKAGTSDNGLDIHSTSRSTPSKRFIERSKRWRGVLHQYFTPSSA